MKFIEDNLMLIVGILCVVFGLINLPFIDWSEIQMFWLNILALGFCLGMGVSSFMEYLTNKES